MHGCYNESMTAQDQSNASIPQNEKVMYFIKQMVQKKYGSDISQDFLNTEAEKLYNKFSEDIVSYFKPFISGEHKEDLDNLINKSGNEESVLAFLMDSIDNFEQKIVQVLLNFRNSYLNDKLINSPRG